MTEPHTLTPAAPALTGKCFNCEAPHAVLYFDPPYAPFHLCPECFRRHALYDAAYGQLELLIRESVAAWISVWGETFRRPDLGERFRHMAEVFDGEEAAQHEARTRTVHIQPPMNAEQCREALECIERTRAPVLAQLAALEEGA
ncbi:hypothetical protein [Deinococcus sp. QL22]|uniref:hypothetical protein n=1 Tax=Deinococcus sp. QL22 TaxID=2939437 RepID=UPI0020183CC1|nr:hypothetical protein [Deinococcus sp. QL22]UQN04968.1 hypothetical protein M1R55_08580 [Deinococcus sp. QL22]